MRAVAGVTFLLAVAASAAHAAPASDFVLVYEAPDGAGCPTMAALRAAVTGELGFDPWDPIDDGTSPRIVVTIRPAHDGVRGRVEMRAPDGRRRLGARELEAARCGELSQALTLAIAVAIDPLHALVPPPPKAQPEEPPPPKRVAPPVDAELPPLFAGAPTLAHPRLVDEMRLRVAFGLQGTVAASPGPTVGFMGRVGFALRRWSLAVELRGDLPGSDEVDHGHISASTMAAYLVPCVEHHAVVAFCVLGGAGAQEVAGSGYLLARSAWVPYVVVGARIEAAVPLNHTLALLFRVDLQVPITRTELYIGTERPTLIYRSAPLSNSFGVAVSTR